VALERIFGSKIYLQNMYQPRTYSALLPKHLDPLSTQQNQMLPMTTATQSTQHSDNLQKKEWPSNLHCDLCTSKCRKQQFTCSKIACSPVLCYSDLPDQPNVHIQQTLIAAWKGAHNLNRQRAWCKNGFKIT
jgi:hypothetical protein